MGKAKENLIFINVENTLQTWDSIILREASITDLVLDSNSVKSLDSMCTLNEASLVIISYDKEKSFNYYEELLRSNGLSDEVGIADCICIAEGGDLSTAIDTYIEFKRDNILNYVIIDSGGHLRNLEYRRLLVNKHYGLTMAEVPAVLHLFSKPYLFDKDNIREVNIIKSLFVYANSLIENPSYSKVQDMFCAILKLEDEIVLDIYKPVRKQLLVECLTSMGIENEYNKWSYEDVVNFFKSLVESLNLVKVGDGYPLLKVTTPKKFCEELNICDSMSLLDEYTIDVILFTVVHK